MGVVRGVRVTVDAPNEQFKAARKLNAKVNENACVLSVCAVFEHAGALYLKRDLIGAIKGEIFCARYVTLRIYNSLGEEIFSCTRINFVAVEQRVYFAYSCHFKGLL
jgi:hypothetical protein